MFWERKLKVNDDQPLGTMAGPTNRLANPNPNPNPNPTILDLLLLGPPPSFCSSIQSARWTAYSRC